MNLDDIENEIGEKIMNEWYTEALNKGRKEGKSYFQLPSFISKYIIKKHEEYKSTINES